MASIPLVNMPAGYEATVAEIQGGHGVIKRLEALGIRPGKRITKISGPFMHGPVTVQIGNARAALGFGIARKVFVDAKGIERK